MSPRIQIDLDKLRFNLQALRALESSRGATIFYSLDEVGVHPRILDLYLKEGVRNFSTTKVENLAVLHEVADILLYNRQPAMSKLETVVELADCSYHSEAESINKASDIALARGRCHGVILLVEAGDLGLGCSADQIEPLIDLCQRLRGVELLGIGYCSNRFAGILPEQTLTDNLQMLAEWVQQSYGGDLPAILVEGPEFISSAFGNCIRDFSGINQLVVGSEIYSGHDVASNQSLVGLRSELITLVSEIIENKRVNSCPTGGVAACQTPARLITENCFTDRGMIRRITLDLNLCHCDFLNISVYRDDLQFLGATTDYSVFETGNSLHDYNVGSTISFKVEPQGIYQLFNYADLPVELI